MIGSGGFARAAKTYSQGPTASEGGKLGKFERGTMAPIFEEQLAGLTEGQYTQPFEEADGIHILRLDRVIEAGNRKELTDERREELASPMRENVTRIGSSVHCQSIVLSWPAASDRLGSVVLGSTPAGLAAA